MTTPDLDLSTHTAGNYDKGRRLHWLVLWHAVGNLVFKKWWFPARFRPALLRAFGAQVSDDVNIREDVHVQWPWNLRIDGPTWVGQGVYILSVEKVHIERDVCLSQEVMLCTGSHDRTDPGFEHVNRPIRVGRGAWLCSRAIVLPGTTVGDHAVVGAGAVVRGRVRPSSVVASPQAPSDVPAPRTDGLVAHN